MASNLPERCAYGKYEFKDEKQVKLVPTAECYGLDALETLKTSTGETYQNDESPEDLWPNLSALVTRLQQLYIGSHEEKLSAREHGFDRDFWAGFPSDRTSKLYRVHVKPRSSIFDPRLCATFPIPVGVEIQSRKTYLQEIRSRRVAQLEHQFNDDKNLWSGVVEGSRWIGVSAFHLLIAATPLVMRTGKDRETGTGYSKPFVQPKRRPRDVSWSQTPSRVWDPSGTQELGRTESETNCSVETVAQTWSRRCTQWRRRQWKWALTATRQLPTPLFDLSHCQRVGPLFWIHYGKLCTATGSRVLRVSKCPIIPSCWTVWNLRMGQAQDPAI